MRSGTTALGALLLVVLGPGAALATTKVHISMPSHVDPDTLSISSMITNYTTDDSANPLTGNTLLNGGAVGGLNLLDRIPNSGTPVPITQYCIDINLPGVQADSTVGTGFSSFTPWTAWTGSDGRGGTLIVFQAAAGSAPILTGSYEALITADSTDPGFGNSTFVATGTAPEFSTVAMMIAGSVGVFGSGSARRLRRALVASG